jgi:hypothetical protein
MKAQNGDGELNTEKNGGTQWENESFDGKIFGVQD